MYVSVHVHLRGQIYIPSVLHTLFVHWRGSLIWNCLDIYKWPGPNTRWNLICWLFSAENFAPELCLQLYRIERHANIAMFIDISVSQHKFDWRIVTVTLEIWKMENDDENTFVSHWIYFVTHTATKMRRGLDCVIWKFIEFVRKKKIRDWNKR